MQLYMKRANIDWKGSKYALKFLVPGLPEAFVRYTKTANSANLEVKIKLYNEIFFPMIPEFYTIVHVAACAPFPPLLEKLLELDYLYTKDAFGKTPLAYALEARQSESVEIIIGHFKDNPEKFIVTENDLCMMLKSHPAMGVNIAQMSFFNFNELYQTAKRGVLPRNFVTLTCEDEFLKQSDLDRNGLSLKGDRDEMMDLTYLVSSFNYNAKMGSRSSIEFLQTLLDSRIDSIWNTDFRYLIENRWSKAKDFWRYMATARLVYFIVLALYGATASFALCLLGFLLSIGFVAISGA